MEKQFVTYEIALKLKELEFDEECLASYHNTKIIGYEKESWLVLNEDSDQFLESTFICKAPLWQQAISFLNDKLYTEHDKAAYSPEWLYYDGRSIKIIEQDILKVLELCQKEK